MNAKRIANAIPTQVYLLVGAVAVGIYLAWKLGDGVAKIVDDVADPTSPTRVDDAAPVRTGPPPPSAPAGEVSGKIRSGALVENPLFGNSVYRLEWSIYNGTNRTGSFANLVQLVEGDFRADSPDNRVTLAPGETKDYSALIGGQYSGSFASPLAKLWIDGKEADRLQL